MKKYAFICLAIVAVAVVSFTMTTTTNENSELMGISNPVYLQIDGDSQISPVFAATPVVATAVAATVGAVAATVNAAVNVARFVRTRRGATYEIKDTDVLMSNLD